VPWLPTLQGDETLSVPCGAKLLRCDRFVLVDEPAQNVAPTDR
jgi:hypothetical protein